MTFKTEQEAFWAGEFGNEYIQRNQGDALVAANLGLFAKALSMTRGVNSCIEFGANIGLNLKALKLLFPAQEQYAVEINASAARELTRVIPPSNLYRTSILDFNSERTWDLVLIKGVLIHINPEMLSQVYDKLEAACSRYLLVVEYYNPVPVTVAYRGHTDRLFKRDFAGEIMDRHSHMRLVDYGFIYRRDPNFPLDDANWFLLEKRR
jgi:pseudaminic acid biosynthesis-associated methylase